MGLNKVGVLHVLLCLHNPFVDRQTRRLIVGDEGRGGVMRRLEVLHRLSGQDCGALGDKWLRAYLKVFSRVVQRLVLVRNSVDLLGSRLAELRDSALVNYLSLYDLVGRDLNMSLVLLNLDGRDSLLLVFVEAVLLLKFSEFYCHEGLFFRVVLRVAKLVYLPGAPRQRRVKLRLLNSGGLNRLARLVGEVRLHGLLRPIVKLLENIAWGQNLAFSLLLDGPGHFGPNRNEAFDGSVVRLVGPELSVG